MRFTPPSLFLLSFFTGSVSLVGQQMATTVQRDPQALAVIAQALAAAGGSTQLRAVQDFTASGSITYLWAGKEVQGTVTLRGRGAQEFRLDANLPQGTRSWTVSNGEGSLLETTGEKTSIPFSNSWNLGNLSVPLLGMLAAINDSSMSVVLVGQLAVGNKQVYDVRLQKNFSTRDDPSGDLSRWSMKDFLIDTTAFTVVEARDVEYSNSASWQSFQQQIAFSDYRAVNGLNLPFSMTETINGQQTWSIQLTSITFNTGLADSIFQF